MAISAAAGFAGARVGGVIAKNFSFKSRIGDLNFRAGVRSNAIVSSGAGGTAGAVADILGQNLLDFLQNSNFSQANSSGSSSPSGGSGGSCGGQNSNPFGSSPFFGGAGLLSFF